MSLSLSSLKQEETRILDRITANYLKMMNSLFTSYLDSTDIDPTEINKMAGMFNVAYEKLVEKNEEINLRVINHHFLNYFFFGLINEEEEKNIQIFTKLIFILIRSKMFNSEDFINLFSNSTIVNPNYLVNENQKIALIHFTRLFLNQLDKFTDFGNQGVIIENENEIEELFNTNTFEFASWLISVSFDFYESIRQVQVQEKEKENQEKEENQEEGNEQYEEEQYQKNEKKEEFGKNYMNYLSGVWKALLDCLRKINEKMDKFKVHLDTTLGQVIKTKKNFLRDNEGYYTEDFTELIKSFKPYKRFFENKFNNYNNYNQSGDSQDDYYKNSGYKKRGGRKNYNNGYNNYQNEDYGENYNQEGYGQDYNQENYEQEGNYDQNYDQGNYNNGGYMEGENQGDEVYQEEEEKKEEEAVEEKEEEEEEEEEVEEDEEENANWGNSEEHWGEENNEKKDADKQEEEAEDENNEDWEDVDENEAKELEKNENNEEIKKEDEDEDEADGEEAWGDNNDDFYENENENENQNDNFYENENENENQNDNFYENENEKENENQKDNFYENEKENKKEEFDGDDDGDDWNDGGDSWGKDNEEQFFD